MTISKENECEHCQCPLQLNQDPVVSICWDKQILSHRQHVHKATMITQSQTKKDVIFKTIRKLQEWNMLVHLDDIFKAKTSKPHMPLLNVIERTNHKKKTVTLILEQGPTDLFEYVQKGETTLSPSLCIQILKCMLQKISLLHDHNIAHLDLSVENVLFGQGEVFLIDFECARFLDPDAKIHFNQGDKKVTVGKLEYITQEVLWQLPFNGFQADIFAIGVIAFILFFGGYPFLKHDSTQYKLFRQGQIGSLLGLRRPNPQELKMIAFIKLCSGTEAPLHAGVLLEHELFH